MFPISMASSLKLSFLLHVFLCPLTIVLSDPRADIVERFCNTLPVKNSSSFFLNFILGMEPMPKIVEKQKWGLINIGNASNSPFFALVDCMFDLSTSDCLQCFAEARTKLPRCLPLPGRIFLDGCFFRYDNYNFSGEATDAKKDKTICNSTLIAENQEFKLKFSSNVEILMKNLIETAAENDGFQKSLMQSSKLRVYGLVQCWKTVSKKNCSECLESGWEELKGCLPGREGRRLNAGCYLRYSNQKFYNDEDGKRGGALRTGIVVSISALSVLAFSLFVTGVWIIHRKMKKKRQEQRNLGSLTSIPSWFNLNFKYETLEKATNFFSPFNKLGQGGSGTVYKGILPDGRPVAVKRLFFNTREWVDELFNEVNLISRIEHKNLVKLLGCSIEGPESLLIYEYLPNKSLDQLLFNKRNVEVLSWPQRLNIIIGTAEGLEYLHFGSGLRIVHRDIKSSNILLDEHLNPKIADFGLVRCFPSDQTHMSTGIAGTLGYMAPEYLVRGQFTEKVDVFSFGILLLEIVSGKKNSISLENSRSLLQTVWKNYLSNTLLVSVDPALEIDFRENRVVTDVMKIGLLCTQVSVSLRPTMTEVVQMLKNGECTIPLPLQPPFLNTRGVSKDNSKTTSDSNLPSHDSAMELSGPR